MPKRLAHLLLLPVLLTVVAFLARTPQPQGWIDLRELSGLDEVGEGHGYQRWVEREGAALLLVTLRKYHGGNRNRGWSVEVTAAPVGIHPPPRERRWSWDGWEKRDESASLAEFHGLECVDDFQFGQTVPQFWYRVTNSRFELLARQRGNPWNADFDQQEGYFLWTPGSPWRESDRWGTPGAVATCHHQARSPQQPRQKP